MKKSISMFVAVACLLTSSVAMSDETRTYGIGTSVGIGDTSTTLVGYGSQGTLTGWPTLELSKFLANGDSLQLSVPVGSMLYYAGEGQAQIGAKLFYNRDWFPGYLLATDSHGNTLKPLLSPGAGLETDFSSLGQAYAVGVGARLGVQGLTEDKHYGLSLYLTPGLGVGQYFIKTEGSSLSPMQVDLSMGIALEFQWFATK